MITCMECGARFATVAESTTHAHMTPEYFDALAERRGTFEEMSNLESAFRGDRASLQFAPIGLPDHAWQVRHAAVRNTRRDLYALLDSLTPVEKVAYGTWRKQNAH